MFAKVAPPKKFWRISLLKGHIMVATLKKPEPDVKSTAHYWRQMPARMTILYITARQRTGAWLTDLLSSYGSVHIELKEALGAAAGLARLRDDAFDAVLVGHTPGELDALQLVEAYRASGAEEPILVLGAQSEQEMAGLSYEAGADGYLCVHTATTRNLIWVIARSIQRHQLLCENHRLNLNEQSRLQRERDEAERLLKEQRALIGDLHALGKKGTGPICATTNAARRCPPLGRSGKLDLSPFSTSGDCHDFRVNENGTVPFSTPDPPLPPELYAHCKELLRTYVIMGSGNLGDELKCLAELLVDAGISARQTMQLHLKVLEEMVRGLGARSARHVMTRADLFACEIMIHLADGYQQKYERQSRPHEQLVLPGF
jgi:DNA-binding NarL/FixJ family response regulator